MSIPQAPASRVRDPRAGHRPRRRGRGRAAGRGRATSACCPATRRCSPRFGSGMMWYRKGTERKYAFIDGGFAEVVADRVSVLAQVAERAEDIDDARAEAAKRRAEERLARPVVEMRLSKRARLAMLRAITRLQVSRHIATSWLTPHDDRHLGRRLPSRSAPRRQRGLLLHPGRHRAVHGRGRHGRPRRRRSRVEAGRRSHRRRSSTTRATPTSTRRGRFPYDTALSLDGNRLKAAFRLANRRLGTAMEGNECCAAWRRRRRRCLFAKGTPVVAHVGDSRVYLFRDGSLHQVTQDHSWVSEQVRAGVLTETDARRHPWRNVVTRALAGRRRSASRGRRD